MIMTKEEFAKTYRKIFEENNDLLADIDGTSAIYDIPTVRSIVDCLNNNEIDEIQDTLLDLKEYFNKHYDPEDPDCASELRRIELLLTALENLNS